MIIAAYAGTGKTHFALLYPELVTDLVSMPYKYEIDKNTIYDETSKANPEHIFNDEWPYNYISAIKENLKSNKLLLIPTDYLVLGLLRVEKFPYCLCYPQRKDKEIYRERYIKRGNTADFIDIFIGRWDRFMDSFENDSYGQHIVLQSGQFLSDVIDVS